MARPLSKQSLIRITATGLKEHTCDRPTQWLVAGVARKNCSFNHDGCDRPTQWLVTARLPHTGGGVRHANANDRPPRVLLQTRLRTPILRLHVLAPPGPKK